MFSLFDWDDANLAHIARHEVLPHEAEEAYNSDPFYLEYSLEDGEERHHEIGETLAGRILLVISTMRGNSVRIVTAYTPKRAWRMAYLEFKESKHHGKAHHS